MVLGRNTRRPIRRAELTSKRDTQPDRKGASLRSCASCGSRSRRFGVSMERLFSSSWQEKRATQTATSVSGSWTRTPSSRTRLEYVIRDLFKRVGLGGGSVMRRKISTLWCWRSSRGNCWCRRSGFARYARRSCGSRTIHTRSDVPRRHVDAESSRSTTSSPCAGESS